MFGSLRKRSGWEISRGIATTISCLLNILFKDWVFDCSFILFEVKMSFETRLTIPQLITFPLLFQSKPSPKIDIFKRME